MKLKKVFTIQLIFLFCFYGIWLSHGNAEVENGSIEKDLGRASVNKETQASDTGGKYFQTAITKESRITSEIKEDKPSTDYQPFDNEETEPQESAGEIITSEAEALPAEEREVSLSALDENPSPVIAEEKIPSFSSPPPSDSPQDEETHSIDEEKEDQATVVDNKEQGNAIDEEESPSLEEERSSTSHLINADEKEPQDIEEEDISSDLSESFPVTVHEKKTLSEFGIEGNESSENTSPVNEDKYEIVTDKDVPSDIKERETFSVTYGAEPFTASSGERAPLVQEEEGIQTSEVSEEQQGIIPDDESISLLHEEKLSADLPPIDSEETDSQKPAGEVTTSEIQALPIEQSEMSLTTLDETPSLVIADEKIPTSDIEERENLQENPSVNEDDQNVVAEEEIVSDTPSIAISDLPADEEMPLIEEEMGDQYPVADNKLRGNGFEEERSEDRSSINGLISGEEKKEFHKTEGKDISSDVSESFPVTVHENTAPSEYGIRDNEGSAEEAPPVTEDKHGIVADKDAPSDGKEDGTLSLTPKTEQTLPPAGTRGSLVQQEEEDRQRSEVAELQQATIPDDGAVSLTEEEKPSTDTQPSDNERIKPAWGIWHSDPTHSIILAVVIILIAGKIGGWIARRMGFPGIVGKIILGMILGNSYLFTGLDYFDFLKTMPFLKMISYFGTLVLLLTAGLHTDIRAILRVGPSSVLVCLGGMIVPAGLTLVVSYFLLPDASTGSKVLLAIVLCSTSTGLLFAILNELKIMNTTEGRIITGATILTEIVVIVSFGIVSGIVVQQGVSLIGISVSFGVACFLLITAVTIIVKYGEKFGNFLTNRLTEGLNIPIIVILSLLMAFMFGSIGLHTVIGAFIAGLFLHNVKLKNSDDNEHRNVESFIRPFYALLVPILFVRVGALVDLKSFLHLDALLLGINITGVAIIGKLFCGICSIEKGTNRLLISFGMAMKLEGSLILAVIGSDVGIFNNTVFSSIIMAIVFTSTICPFFMKRVLLTRNAISNESISNESIRIDPEKTEIAVVPDSKRKGLKIFGFYLI